MNLRKKLLLAQAPLVIAILVLVGLGLWAVSRLGARSRLILQDNYRSVVAAQRMAESLERIDSGVLFCLLSEPARGRELIDKHRAEFERELEVQKGNITEEGEREQTILLQENWKNYLSGLDDFERSENETERRKIYFDSLQLKFDQAKSSATRILDINQDAMQRKSREANRESQTTNRVMTVSTIVALLIGFFASTLLMNHILRPLSILKRAMDQLGGGNFQARAMVIAHDEIGQFAEQFNQMAEHLNDYRSSSLGELLLAQQASQAAINGIPEPVVVFNASGGVLMMNSQAENLFYVGQAFSENEFLSRLEPALRSAIDAARTSVLRGEGPVSPTGLEDAVCVTQKGVECWYILRANPVYDSQRNVSGVTVILQDVTKLRRVDQLKNDMVATVAHEFRTPLTSLRMAIHLCLEQVAGPTTDKQTELLQAGREDCERLQTIVDELLDLAKIQAGKMEIHLQPIPPATLLRDTLDSFHAVAEGKKIRLTSYDGANMTTVDVDPDQIRLVFSNLMANALRHTDEGGAVSIKTKPVADFVRFEITDSGEGIPLKYQSAIFNRFYRVPGSKSGAAGLGLPLSKEIVVAHGGEIGVESKPGSGSTFWFTLPISQSNTK